MMDKKKVCDTCIGTKIYNVPDVSGKVTLLEYCIPQFYKRNEIIFRQNTPSNDIIYVKEGLLKIVKEAQRGKQFIFKIIKGPAYVDLTSVFGKHILNYSAYALTDTSICTINKEWFFDTMENNGKFAKHILEINCNEETTSTNRLLTLLRKQVTGRMADVLLFFSNNIFQSCEFDLPLTREEMANFIGISKKSFIRTFNKFKNDKLISVNGKRIKIVREDLLIMLSRIG